MSEKDIRRLRYEMRLNAFLEKYADRMDAEGAYGKAEYVRHMMLDRWPDWCYLHV